MFRYLSIISQGLFIINSNELIKQNNYLTIKEIWQYMIVLLF